MEKQTVLEEEKVSIKNILLRLGGWLGYLVSHWKLIGIGTAIFLMVYSAYHLLRKPNFRATTSFVLEVGKGSQGSISSLASAVGLSLGDLTGSNSELFSSDNILELYRSYRMLKETFLSKREVDGQSQRLITRFLTEEKLLKKWRRKDHLKDFSFEIPVSEMGVLHDSLMMEVVEDFRRDNLVAEDLSRRTTILLVSIISKDQMFAKAFNEELVQRVNTFYQEINTKKTAKNLKILQKQADSVRQALDAALLRYGVVTENRPNPNPVLTTNQVEYQRLLIEIQTSTAVYEEVLRQLELAKISHFERLPLIQIVDRPLLPLEDDRMKILKMLVYGGAIGGFLMVLALTALRLYRFIFELDA